MSYDPYKAQKRIKAQNRNKIERILQDKPRTFSEIRKLTGFSPMGLTKMLEDLIKEKRIRGGGQKGIPYRTSGTHAKELLYVGNTISEIVDSGGKFYVDYTDSFNHLFGHEMFFGIMSHLMIDKRVGKKYNPFSKEIVFRIENFLFEQILDGVKHQKIIPDKSTTGKLVLAFEIEYEKLMKDIESYSQEDHKEFIKERLMELKNK
jgi:hypothetical protein